MKTMKWMAAALVSLSLSAHAVEKKDVINNISYNVILQTYKDLAQKTVDMKAAVELFSAQPTEANLAKAQQAWRDMRVPWESSESFLFGPVDSLGVDPLMDTWPLNRLDLDAVLNSNRSITVDFIRVLGVNVQGFHTLEYLLFGDGINTNVKPLAAFNQRQFEYLKSTAALMVEHTAELASAWTTHYDPENPGTPAYISIISNPNFNNQFYSSEFAVLEEFVQGMMKISDEVGSGKMSDPFGANAGQANVTLVESPFSWNSLNDFTHNIESVYNIYTGSYLGVKRGPGIQEVVADQDPALAAKVANDIRHCMDLIQAIKGANNMPFRQAIQDGAGRARIQVAIDALAQLRNEIESDVLPLMDN